MRHAAPAGGGVRGRVSAHLEKKMSLTLSKGTTEVAPRNLQTKAASGERGGGFRAGGVGGGGGGGGEVAQSAIHRC